MDLLDATDKKRFMAVVVDWFVPAESQHNSIRNMVTSIVSEMVGIGFDRVYVAKDVRDVHHFNKKMCIDEVKWLPNGCIAISFPKIKQVLSLRVTFVYAILRIFVNFRLQTGKFINKMEN